MRHYNKLIEPKDGVVGTSDIQIVRSTGNNLGLQLASEVEGGLVGLSPLTVESNSICRYIELFFSCLFYTYLCIYVNTNLPVHPTTTPPPHFLHLVSIRLFSTSVSLFLPCTTVHL